MRYPRRLWGARKRRRHPGTLDPAQVVGVALHWPGMAQPLRDPAAVRAALRSWQNYHMDTNGWSDIAYQGAVDQDGHYYVLRGLRRRSAANGNTDLNLRYGALLLVLAPGEQPSKKMTKKVRKVIRRHRRKFPHSTRIVGHGEIRPGGTACPGPAVNTAIRQGTFKP